jgi:hypothetical protein
MACCITQQQHERREVMSDKTIRLLIDLTYDSELMHGDDEESIEWFNSILLGDHLQLGEFGDLGDMIGSVKVIEQGADRIEELEAKLAGSQTRLEVMEEQLKAANAIIATERSEVLSLRAENKALRDVATDAIETMEAGPFFPADEGKRLRAAIAKIGGQE